MNYIKEKQDLRYLQWSHIRSSSGTAGSFLKSQSNVGGTKKYYKLSNYNANEGIIGVECINEIIVDRLLTILRIDHLSYTLINADIEIDGKIFSTYLCESTDFKKPGESKTSLDDYYRINRLSNETPFDFCVRNGWRKYIEEMIAVDYLILNRDRHGANIEVLKNPKTKEIRIAPLFDHGLSLLFNCEEKELAAVDVLQDRRCNNFIGGSSCYKNLSLIKDRKTVFKEKLKETDKEIIFADLTMLSKEYIDKVWEMITKRIEVYENI